MGAYRHLAHLLFVAIIVIAAGFVSSPAQAHGGHGHGPAAQDSSKASVAVAPSAEARQNARVTPYAEAIVVSGIGSPRDLAEPSCNGTCCSTGLSCCTPGVTSDDYGLHLSIGSASLIVWPDTPAVSDIYLEALPKPPPSFA